MPDEPPKPAATPGWYDDPDEPGGKRYWDGSQWTDKRRLPESKGRIRRWYSSLSRGVQWLVAVVVGAGAVAGAISAILALLPGPAPALHANLSQVSVGSMLTLNDWASRVASGTVSAPSGTTASRLAADVMVQAGDETTSVGGASGQQGPGLTVQPTPLSQQDVKDLNDGLELAMPAATSTNVGAACAAGMATRECGLRSTATYLLEAHSPPTAETVKDQLLKLFDSMRKEPAPPAVGVPVGVEVDVNISLTGLSGHTADVRWTLYRANGFAHVPEDWARGESVLEVSGNAPEASASKAFFVPFPSKPGPYTIHLGVYDEDNNRLDYARGNKNFGG
jgi:hypothetical protein